MDSINTRSENDNHASMVMLWTVISNVNNPQWMIDVANEELERMSQECKQYAY